MTRYEPIVPDGQHLGTSHEVDGAVTGHLFSDSENKLQGHAAWREVEDPEEDYFSRNEEEPPRQLTQEEIERAAELAVLLIFGVIKGVQWASPRVKGWWDGTAAPKFKRAWQTFRGGRRKAPETIDLGDLTASRATFVTSTAAVEIAVATSRITLTRAEWDRRLQAMLAAGLFQAEQRRILANAQIAGDERAIDAYSSQQELTPHQFADHVRSILEANPSLLSDTSTAEIVRALKRPGPGDDGNLSFHS